MRVSGYTCLRRELPWYAQGQAVKKEAELSLGKSEYIRLKKHACHHQGTWWTYRFLIVSGWALHLCVFITVSREVRGCWSMDDSFLYHAWRWLPSCRAFVAPPTLPGVPSHCTVVPRIHFISRTFRLLAKFSEPKKNLPAEFTACSSEWLIASHILP